MGWIRFLTFGSIWLLVSAVLICLLTAEMMHRSKSHVKRRLGNDSTADGFQNMSEPVRNVTGGASGTGRQLQSPRRYGNLR